jgi:organic radical activating enzyme
MVFYDTTFSDYPDPINIAVIVFLSGCSHNCKGCQNPALQKIHEKFSEQKNKQIVEKIKKLCKDNNTNKVVLSGGDCLNDCNISTTKKILNELSEDFDIIIYTGYSIEEVHKKGITGYKFIKCGKFDCNNIQPVKKTDEYIQFVNKTQNLYDHSEKQISANGRYYFKHQGE